MKYLRLISTAALCVVAGCPDEDTTPGGSGDASETTGSTDAEAGGASGGPTGSDGSDTDDFAGCGVDIDELFECPTDASLLGSAGAFTSEAFSFTWDYDEACQISVGPPMFFDVAPDTEALILAFESGSAFNWFHKVTNAGTLLVDGDTEGPGGLGLPPLKHSPFTVGVLGLPMSADTTPLPGCLAVVPAADGDLSGTQSELRAVTRRGPLDSGTFELNFVIVDGAEITSEELVDAAAILEPLLEENNAGLPLAFVVEVESGLGTFFPSEGAELDALRALPLDVPEQSMNVFFIDDFLDGGFLGLAAGIPGPNGALETVGSGVVVGIDPHRNAETGDIEIQLLAETIAHEAGHQFGLFHTSESDGSEHDLASDTPECTLDEHDGNGDGFLDQAECPDGNNIMFWTGGVDTPQTVLSPEQSGIILFSPISL